MVTYKCSQCGQKVRVVPEVCGVTCNAAGKHRQMKMEKTGR